MENTHAKIFIILTLIIGIIYPVSAAFVYFDSPTDTIDISGQTVLSNTSTYEAVLLMPNPATGGGVVFMEFTNALEDKQFGIGSGAAAGFNFPSASGVIGPATIVANQWHHVAFVDTPTEERLYFDGNLIGSQAGAATIGNGSDGGHLGATDRNGSIAGSTSFIGYLDSFRISDNERYTGASFTPNIGDFTNDANTQLLYNFNDPLGGSTVTDASANNRTGTLGVGFGTATSPEVVAAVPEPSTYVFLLTTIAGVIIIRCRGKREEKRLSIEASS